MKRLKIFPKTFFYSLGIMLFIVAVAHLLLYLLTPKMAIAFMPAAGVEINGAIISSDINPLQFLMQTIRRTLPISLSCCILLSVVCSYLFSRGMTIPIRQLSEATERMAELDKKAVCSVDSLDEIGELAEHVNQLYQSLLSTIENLEAEKKRVSESERSKVDFLRAASHELKTPVTALNAILENMILQVGKYQDYQTYLPECKELVEQLSAMLHEILDASKMNFTVSEEAPVQADLSQLMADLCQPYQLIAAAHGLSFSLDLPQQFPIHIAVQPFSKAISNLLSNAVAYTERGKSIFIYMDGRRLVIENECVPICREEIRRLFEPFYRPDFSRSRDSGGNGLGLTIVDTIFSALHISYEFEPMEQPRGMRFSIWL